ncbi:hypothetical protein FRC17_001533 [Serendipita sp. 399]|nr:hypothetical protein FRC17_001533 [Serendipita sp. 399]
MYNSGDWTAGEPDISDLKIDWSLAGITPWTRRAAALLEADFLTQYRLGSFPKLSTAPLPGVVAAFTIEYIEARKRTLMKKPSDDRMRIKRQRARVNKLYKSRLQTAKQYDMDPKIIDDIEQLGIGGMSSDESEGDEPDENRKFFIKVLPWRHPNVETWIHDVDQLISFGPEGLPRRSRGLRIRQLSPIQSTRPCSNEIPLHLVDPKWISRQNVAAQPFGKPKSS